MHIDYKTTDLIKLAVFDPDLIGQTIIENLRSKLAIIQHPQVSKYGIVPIHDDTHLLEPYTIIAILPPMYPEWLGGRTFNETHHTRFAYIGGAMARGIGSAELVIALARNGMLGFLGAAGMSLPVLEANLQRLSSELDPSNLSWGSNLIHTPHAPQLEESVVDLYLKFNVKRVSASAFMDLSPSIVRYACNGLRLDEQGRAVRSNFVFAKISRPEVAQRFLSPPPNKLLEQLVEAQSITPREASIAATLPIAEDITVEADSGGHTDNRPLGSLFPVIHRLASELSQKNGYARPIRIGAAGGLGTPQSVASAFALGAAYVLIGSVHQSALESGLSPDGKHMLAEAGMADVAMTASADMFEAGVKVQVLKRGTLMANRGNTLYRIFKEYASIDDIPQKIRREIEQSIFKTSLTEIWNTTKNYFAEKDPAQIAIAEKNPKRKMALIFRWYLGNSSHWPITGDTNRRADYQIWCGAAMGAFNDWTRGSFLEDPGNRTVQQIALNLMEGAAYLTRLHQMRASGVEIPSHNFQIKPRMLAL